MKRFVSILGAVLWGGVCAFAADPDSVARPAVPRLVPVVVRSSAPVGSQVTLDGEMARMDSTGRFLAGVLTDSLRRATGSFELCLLVSGQKLCTPIRPQGFDTLDIAPLEVKIDSVVETRDTIRTIVDTTRFDSTALKAPTDAKLVKSSAGNTVTVRGKRRPPRVLGQERVTVQTIKRLPGLAEPDVIRAVQALPGVVQSSDFSTKLYVRGSSSDQNLILFDNAAVYSPAHFGGLFSTFLADATGGLDFYKGGFDPKYGNRLSSVLLVSSKVGASDYDSTLDSTRTLRRWADKGLRATEGFITRTNSDSISKAKMQGALRLTTFSGSIATDGRQDEVSWSGGARSTWIGSALEIARDLDLTTLALDYDFWDWQASAAWGRAGDSVRVSAYDGRDKLGLGLVSADWGNLAIPVNVRKRLGSDWIVSGTGSYSKYDQVVGFSDIFTFSNQIESWTGRGEFQWTPHPIHRLSAGYEFNHFDVMFRQDIPVASISAVSNTWSDLHAAYLQDRVILDTTKSVSVGLRANNDTKLVKDLSWDPRISFTWRFAPDWKMDAHFGHYTQYMTSIRFADMEIPTEFWYAAQNPMEPTTQWLTSLGVERQNWGPLGLRASLEGYYKDIYAVPLLANFASQKSDSASDASGTDIFASRFQKLDGWAMGLEAALSKDEGWWTGSVSYAAGWSALKRRDYADELVSTTFDPYWADWDQRNTFKLSGGLNWVGRGKNEALLGSRKQVPLPVKILTSFFPPMIAFWTIDKSDYFRSSMQVAANSGLPMTDYKGYNRVHEPMQGVDGGQGAGGPTMGLDENTATVANPRNVDRRPGYFRLDVTPFDFGRTGKWRFYYTIINITDRENVYSVNYDTKKNPPKREETYQFPILPFFFGYEYQF